MSIDSRVAGSMYARADLPRNQALRLRALRLTGQCARAHRLLPMGDTTWRLWMAGVVHLDTKFLGEMETAIDWAVNQLTKGIR